MFRFDDIIEPCFSLGGSAFSWKAISSGISTGSLAVKVDQEGCALKATVAFFRSTGAQLFPTLLIHLCHLHRALDMARKEKGGPPSGQQ